MRVVLDTNVVVSALLWGGVPYRLLQLSVAGEIDLLTSPTLLSELADVLGRAEFASRIDAQNVSLSQLLTQYQALCLNVLPQSVPAVIAADPADDHVLACAVEGHADMIVSGDRHLHSLGGAYCGIAIAKPAQAIRIIEAG
jgi:putative PIN family toxin of toxin-antitoxin system